MPDYKQNTYDDDDMRAVIDEIEKLEAKKLSIRNKAAADCSAIAAKVKAKKKEAKDDLSIPLKVLNPILRRRKLEQQIADLSQGVDEDFVEVYLDAAGQFCMFAPVNGDDADVDGDDEAEEPETVKSAAAKSDQALKDAVAAQEQSDGEKVLERAH